MTLNQDVPYKALAGVANKGSQRIDLNSSAGRMMAYYNQMIQYEKVRWLQNNNPEVLGLVYKLAPLDKKMHKLGECSESMGGNS